MSKFAPTGTVASSAAHPRRGADSPAFLLAQVGGHAAARFTERLATLRIAPADAGILRIVQATEGISQQALGVELGVAPSRLVTLLDDLEKKGMIERRDHPEDRRSYALHVTNKGRELLKNIGQIARDHQQALLAALTDAEREQLTLLLKRIADEQGLRPGVHPGFSRSIRAGQSV
jgi:DNA-binding MarR family transcriptional regulator